MNDLYLLAGERMIIDCPLTDNFVEPCRFVKALLSQKVEQRIIPDDISNEIKEVIITRKYIPQIILELLDFCEKNDDPLFDLVAAVCAIYTVAYDDVEESTFSRDQALNFIIKNRNA